VSTRHDFPAGRAIGRSHLRLVRGLDHPPHPVDEPPPERTGRAGSVRHEGRPGLQALLSAWDRHSGPMSEAAIRDGLRGLRLDRHALRHCVHFDERGCQRTRLHVRDHYEVLVVCWQPGQAEPIHDHGGSASGLLVVEGVATEIGFMTTACGRLAPSRSQRVHAGAVVVSRPREVHQVANLEGPGTELISLHVNAPPLSDRRHRRLAETTFADHDERADDPPPVRSAPIAVWG
jgi:cysteine dioxygenase